MNKKIGFLATLFIATALMFGSVHQAEAKRMGGGKSFGSKPSYSAPYQRSTSPSAAGSQPVRSASQQQAAAQNQAARQGWANRGGLMGMLGGLALGGLLGSLFFGGAFEHFNFMDFLVFAGIAYLLYRLFAAKAANQSQPLGNSFNRSAHSSADDSASYPSQEVASSNSAGFNTDIMFDKARQGSDFEVPRAPTGFDQKAFLAGAESAYRYLQAAWDSRDLAAIRGLTTDKVFAEIQEQLRSSNGANKTDVLKLSAELLEIRELGSELEAAVLFDVLLSENDGPSEQIKEVWHFTKPFNSQQPKWFLDGIQQLDA